MASREPGYAQPNSKATNIATQWYPPSIDKYLVPDVQKFFAEYSNVPIAEQSEHVHRIREKAWATRTYPCTGLGVWLEPFLPRSPAFANIVARLQSGQTFLDVGCFMGVDMRQLAHAGAPSENMFGVDIVSHWELGYELFRDRDKFHAHFIETDILADTNPGLKKLMAAKVDIIEISAVLHQWSWDMQVLAVKRLVELAKPGALVVGYQIGQSSPAGVSTLGLQKDCWRHDPASFEQLWDQVGNETNTKWKVQATLRDFESLGWDRADMSWMDARATPLDFVVSREE